MQLKCTKFLGLQVCGVRLNASLVRLLVNHDLLNQPRNQGAVRRVWEVFVTLLNVTPERILHRPTHRGTGKQPLEGNMGKWFLPENAESIVTGTLHRTRAA